MVVYSASKGQQALDRLSDKDANPNSVFTREFIARMKRPGVKIEELVREVQDAVEALAGTIQHEQRPAIYNEARGNFYFFGPTTVRVGSTPSPAPYLAPARTPEQIEDETWNIIKIASDQTSLEEYLKQYPKGRYVAQAKIVLAQVKADNRRASIAPTATSAADGADVEYALWQAISTGNTVDDYEVYIQQYPRGKYAPLARQRIQKKTDEAAAKAQAVEASAWQAVEASKTLESYQGYLKNHPSGIHSALAKTQIENIKDDQSRQEESRAWKMAQSGGVKELKIYLERYATGTYAFEASALLDMLQKAEAKLKIEKNSADDEVKWGWPASGTVAANFDGASNKGIAFNGNGGDAVLAAAEGLVAYAGSGLRGYGNLIILKHNTIYLTSYAHNQTLLVKEGEAVRKGQKIAEMGNSSADQAKFQFEIRKSGKPIDPINLLPVR
jgi:murein DD-endopeptidase MepM/ murein hydrolase activator NlpD